MAKLDPGTLQVESFPVMETMEFEGAVAASPSHLPMCTCQSCTMGFPDCETGPVVTEVA